MIKRLIIRVIVVGSIVAHASCALDTSSDRSGSTSSKQEASGTPAPAPGPQPDSDPAEHVAWLMKDRCISCHGDGAGSGGVNNLSNLENMVDRGLVVPGAPADSLLVSVIEDGSMPPSGEVTPTEVEKLKQWITSLSDLEDTADRQFIAPSAINRLAAQDLFSIEDLEARKHIRYLTLAVQYNAQVEQSKLGLMRLGLNKFVNSLSMQEGLAKATPIGKNKLLLRVDMRQYGWTAETWDRLVRRYPYTIVTEDEKWLGALQKDTGSIAPIVRADWFVKKAGIAPIYYLFLGLSSDFQEFQEQIGVDMQSNIDDKNIVRAGFIQSTVARENRLIERHDSRFGFLWRSYEFDRTDGEQNIFANPLGPKRPLNKTQEQLAAEVPTDDSEPAFDERGGEYIYTLPNGMLGFYLTGPRRERLDATPNTPFGSLGAGADCMVCHKEGMIYRADDVVPVLEGTFVAPTPAPNSRQPKPIDLDKLTFDFPRTEENLAAVKELFADEAKLKSVMNADTQSYKKVLSEFGVNPDEADGITELRHYFDSNMDVISMAAELGVTQKKLETLFPRDTKDAIYQLPENRNVEIKNPKDRLEVGKHISANFRRQMQSAWIHYLNPGSQPNIVRREFERNFRLMTRFFHGQ